MPSVGDGCYARCAITTPPTISALPTAIGTVTCSPSTSAARMKPETGCRNWRVAIRGSRPGRAPSTSRGSRGSTSRRRGRGRRPRPSRRRRARRRRRRCRRRAARARSASRAERPTASSHRLERPRGGSIAPATYPADTHSAAARTSRSPAERRVARRGTAAADQHDLADERDGAARRATPDRGTRRATSAA